MDPDSIPDRLFRGWKSDGTNLNVSQSPDEFEYVQDRTPLLNYSIVEVNEDVSTLHRIVQSTRLKVIPDEERGHAFHTAVHLLAACLPQQVLGNHMYGQWLDCEIYLPHVLSFKRATSDFWNMSDTEAKTYVNMVCDATC